MVVVLFGLYDVWLMFCNKTCSLMANCVISRWTVYSNKHHTTLGITGGLDCIDLSKQ